MRKSRTFAKHFWISVCCEIDSSSLAPFSQQAVFNIIMAIMINRGITRFASFFFSTQQLAKLPPGSHLDPLYRAVASFDLLALLKIQNSNVQNSSNLINILSMDNNQKLNNQIISSASKLGLTMSSIGLSWTGQLLRKLGRYAVDLEVYKASLEHYYGYLEQSKQSQLRLCKHFCYLEDGQLSKMVKQNQVKLVKKWGSSINLSTACFESLINGQLFNITDMPIVSELLYQSYFPAVGRLENLQQIHSSLIYLSKFSKIPFFLPQMTLNLLEQQKNQIQKMSFDRFSQIINIFYLLLFKFPQSLHETNLTSAFWNLFDIFSQTFINKNFVEVKAQGNNNFFFQKVRALSQRQKVLLADKRGMIIKNYEKKLQQIRKISKNQGTLLRQCLDNQIKQLVQFQTNNIRQIKEKTEIQVKIKTNRLIMMAASAPYSVGQMAFSYLNEPGTLQFYQINKCLPDLLLSAQMALTNLQRNQPKMNFQQYRKTFEKLNSISLIIDKDIQTEIQEIVQKMMAGEKREEFLAAFYSEEFQETLWIRDEVERMSKLQLNYCLTDFNLLKFLKNDPRFLVKLTKWNKYNFLTKMINQGQIKERRVQKSKFGEGLGFRVESVESKGTGLKWKSFVLQSELTKNHVFTSSKILTRQELNPSSLKGKPTHLLKLLSSMQKKNK